MSLVKFNNRFPLIDALFGNLWNSDRLFHDDFMVKNQLMPAINIKEKKDTFEIEVAAPGLTKKDFNVKIENDLLIISAEKLVKKKKRRKVILVKSLITLHLIVQLLYQ